MADQAAIVTADWRNRQQVIQTCKKETPASVLRAIQECRHAIKIIELVSTYVTELEVVSK